MQIRYPQKRKENKETSNRWNRSKREKKELYIIIKHYNLEEKVAKEIKLNEKDLINEGPSLFVLFPISCFYKRSVRFIFHNRS